MYHIPIMPAESSQYLINNPHGLYVDCTFGGGGHSQYLLKQNPHITMIAFDWDEDALDQFHNKQDLEHFKERIVFVNENFKNIKEVLQRMNIYKVDGVLADIGVSSHQFDDPERGFSFKSDTLDMRMDKRNPLMAKDIINSFPEEDLADIFYKYGEEYKSRRIAKAIYERRKRGKINTATELVDIICSVKRPEGKINPATKVFQALRIYVNGELDNLEKLLESIPDILFSGGRAVIISFHSLEDRMIKNNFRENASQGIYKVLTKKVIMPSKEEIKNNPRSRSAKIRAVERL